MRRSGFTLIELVIALIVSGILLSITVAGFAAVERRTAVRQARNVFAGLHARARAHAIEFGTIARLGVDLGGDSVWVDRDGTIVETVRIGEEFGVDLSSSVTGITLCMSPRGYADTDCNSFGSAVKIGFARGSSEVMTATLLPLGQLELSGTR